MRNRALIVTLSLLWGGAGILFWALARLGTTPAPASANNLATWDAARAAAYLDRREVWWQGWAPAHRDQGTHCVSCHTVLPYAMARPALRNAKLETEMSAPEKIIMESVEKRVQDWTALPPYYSDSYGPDKAAQSRATEAVLNAVILASYDTRQGYLRPITKTAFDEAWETQETSGEHAGGWKWQNFNLAPWESTESAYQGAALLAVKVQNAPDGYATQADARVHLAALYDYLERSYSSQPVLNQMFVLWASAKSPRALSSERRNALLHQLRSLQQTDGGWSLSSLDEAPPAGHWQWVRKRIKSALRPTESDGCATGLVVLILEESGVNRQDGMLTSGLRWLEQHQNPDGSWQAASLNKKRNPQTDVGRFMSDAATGYAVLALEESH